MSLPPNTNDGMPAPPREIWSPDDSGGSGFAFMRMLAGFGGMLLVGLGVYLCVRLFIFAAQAFESPDALKPMLDKWEVVVRSRAYDDILARESTAGTSPAARNENTSWASDGENPDLASRRENVEAVTRGMIELIGAGARPLAILIMLVLGSILVRIALGLCNVGIQMIQILNPDGRILQKLVDRLNRR